MSGRERGQAESSGKATAKNDRLARALRANLRRRKEQARERAAGSAEEAAPAGRDDAEGESR